MELPEYLPKQRWFAGKSRGIKSIRIADWIPLNVPLNAPSDASQSALVLVEVEFDTGPPDLYFLPLAMSFGDAENELQRTAPNAIIAPVLSQRGAGLLYDGAFDDQTCALLFSLIENASRINARHGVASGAYVERRFWISWCRPRQHCRCGVARRNRATLQFCSVTGSYSSCSAAKSPD